MSDKIEDPVVVPRGLLGAASCAIANKANAPKTLAALRQYAFHGAALAQQPAQAVKIDENAEFEKWRSEQVAVLERNGYPDGAKAFYDLGSVQWSGWQARAMLAAAPAAPAQVAHEPVAVEVMRFQLKHHGGETHTVEFTRAEVADGLEDLLYEKLSPMVCRCNGDADHECGDYIHDFDLVAAPPAAEQPDTVHSLLDERDMHWLRRFQECCEDFDADGHDLPKSAVRDLEQAGALRNLGFGRREITKFGEYLLAGGEA